MATVLLVRHGLTELTGPVLAGWTPGVHLDERGRAQAAALAERLRPVPLAAIVSSPLERCQETAAQIAAGRDGVHVRIDDGLGECRYGDWTGQELKKLAKDPLWRVVQSHPSAAVFPGAGGEPLRVTQERAVAAVRAWNERLGREHGLDVTWLACSHGDVIKAIVADAAGMHLDLFQRIVVAPCSLTVIHYTETRPFLARLNDVGGAVDDLLPPKQRRRSRSRPGSSRSGRDAGDATVGGGG